MGRSRPFAGGRPKRPAAAVRHFYFTKEGTFSSTDGSAQWRRERIQPRGARREARGRHEQSRPFTRLSSLHRLVQSARLRTGAAPTIAAPCASRARGKSAVTQLY